MIKKGLTLIELIISLAVVPIILSLLYSVFFVTLHTFGFGERQRDVVASAGWAVDNMVKELRQARAIYKITENIIGTNRFYNTDIELLTENGLEWVRFYIAEKESSSYYRLLRKNISTGKEKPLVENVKDFQTEYYDRNNIKISDPVINTSDVRLIAINLKVEKASKTSGGTQDVVLKARARPRAIN